MTPRPLFWSSGRRQTVSDRVEGVPWKNRTTPPPERGGAHQATTRSPSSVAIQTSAKPSSPAASGDPLVVHDKPESEAKIARGDERRRPDPLVQRNAVRTQTKGPRADG